VRCFLSTKDPVVLKRKYSEGPISLNECLCDSLSRDHYSPAFLVRKIEQRRDMPTCDNATLANFELPRIDHGECMFAFIYDRPSFFATCHPFTKVARISYGKFDQLPSPIQPAGRRKTLVESALGCGFNRWLQHLSSEYRAEDVVNEATTEDLLYGSR
jgi:hypothetical protein